MSFKLKVSALAVVSQLVFTTPIHTVPPGTLSKVLTVQTRDDRGVETKLTETADLTLTTTSTSGEFTNDKGGKLSLVMSKGSANRNFYYHDSQVGHYLVTATVAGRESGARWQASQVINVGVAQTPDVKEAPTSGVKSVTPTPSVRVPASKPQPPPAPSLIKEGVSRAGRGTGVVEIKQPAGFWSWLFNLLF